MSGKPTRKSAEVMRPAGSDRPWPPGEMIENAVDPLFEPSPEMVAWMRSTFINEGAALQNEDHAHLANASIGVLWTNVSNSRATRRVVGQCETGQPAIMGKWLRERALIQIEAWFGEVPDFILTFDAQYAAVCEDAEFCALVEHELYHAAQERDIYGAPKFSREGRPKFTIQGHDVEEFVGVVRRYGAEAAGVTALVEAANRKPEVAVASIAQACGTCMARAA